ncbi:MAG: hypothetical protein ABH952_09320 [Candidatus Omnitrophota bacterium]
MDWLKKIKIWNIIIFIQKYCYTEIAFLFTPSKSFKRFYSNKKNGIFLNPELFLFTNSIVVYLFFKIPAPIEIKALVPVIKMPIDIFGAMLKYLFGFLVFLLLLGPFLKKYKTNAFSLKIFQIICFASAIYIPSICIKKFIVYTFTTEPFINIVTECLSGIKTISSFLIVLRIFVMPFITGLFLICYWGRLFYLGLKNAISVKPKELFKVTITSIILFLFIQFMLYLAIFRVRLAPIIKAYNNIFVIEKLVTQIPPNYLKAAWIAESIADTKEMTPYYRYRAKIRAIAYKLSTVVVEREKSRHVLPKIHASIKAYNYKNTEKLLTDFLTKMVQRSNDSKYKAVYTGLLDELREAIDYRNSPYYTKEPPDTKYFASYKLTPILLFP